MIKKRHKWEQKKIDTLEKTKCLKCGLIKESLGWIGGYVYYFAEDDFYFQKTTSCGQEIKKQMLKDVQIKTFNKKQLFSHA